MLDQDHIRWLRLINNGTVEINVTNKFINRLKKENFIIIGKDRFLLSEKGQKFLK